jgi:hypothetical protein
MLGDVATTPVPSRLLSGRPPLHLRQEPHRLMLGTPFRLELSEMVKVQLFAQRDAENAKRQQRLQLK